MDKHITIKDLAVELGIDRSNCRKLVKSLNLHTFSVRLPGVRGTALIAVTPDDAEIVRQARIAKGFSIGKPSAEVESRAIKTDDGSFYIIALDREARPGRLKFGFAQNIASRLSDHKVAAPCAELLAHWPAKRCWEVCIMDALTVGCKRVSGEVFDVPDVEAIIDKGKALMRMLPDLQGEQ